MRVVYDQDNSCQTNREIINIGNPDNEVCPCASRLLRAFAFASETEQVFLFPCLLTAGRAAAVD